MQNKSVRVIATFASDAPRQPAWSAPDTDRDIEIRPLHGLFGLSQFQVRYIRLRLGEASAAQLEHPDQDVLVYVLAGNPTLVTDSGELKLAPWMVAGFRAKSGRGYRLINHVSDTVMYLEVRGVTRELAQESALVARRTPALDEPATALPKVATPPPGELFNQHPPGATLPQIHRA